MMEDEITFERKHRKLELVCKEFDKLRQAKLNLLQPNYSKPLARSNRASLAS